MELFLAHTVRSLHRNENCFSHAMVLYFWSSLGQPIPEIRPGWSVLVMSFMVCFRIFDNEEATETASMSVLQHIIFYAITISRHQSIAICKKHIFQFSSISNISNLGVPLTSDLSNKPLALILVLSRKSVKRTLRSILYRRKYVMFGAANWIGPLLHKITLEIFVGSSESSDYSSCSTIFTWDLIESLLMIFCKLYLDATQQGWSVLVQRLSQSEENRAKLSAK